MLLRALERVGVARVGVAHHARAGIRREHALDPFRHRVRPVGDDHHAGVDRIADPDAAAVVDAHPRGARPHVQQRVQDRPVRDRVGSVVHRLRLAERRGDGSRVEVVAPDHDRSLDAAGAHELVDRAAGARAVAVAEPADPRRQPLERDAAGRELEPALQHRVVGEQLPQHVIDRRDVRGVPRQGGPPERADAAAEQRPDIGRNEAWVCERRLDPGL